MNFSHALFLTCLQNSNYYCSSKKNSGDIIDLNSLQAFMMSLIDSKSESLKKNFRVIKNNTIVRNSLTSDKPVNLTKLMIVFSLGQRNFKNDKDSDPRLPRIKSNEDHIFLSRFCLSHLLTLKEDMSSLIMSETTEEYRIERVRNNDYWFSKSCYLDYFDFLKPSQWFELVILTSNKEILERNIDSWPTDQLIKISSHLLEDPNIYKNLACACINKNLSKAALFIIHQDPKPWLPPFIGPYQGQTYDSVARARTKRNYSLSHLLFSKYPNPEVDLYPLSTPLYKRPEHQL